MEAGTSYTVTRKVLLPMRDGVRLAADLWLPQGRTPAPAILFRTPYDRGAYHTDVLRPQQCVEAGFAAVVEDMRGRFASEGEWRPLDWPGEARDSYDTIEWIAAQPWCSGAVGMSGLSYCGTVQLAASRLRPPHLKAIAPALASSPEFDRVESGGALRLDLAVSWLALTAVDWLARRRAAGLPVDDAAQLILRAVRDPRFLHQARPLRDMPLLAIEDFPIGFDEFHARLNQPVDDEGMDLRIPALHIGGWYDLSHSTAVGLFRRQAAAGNPHSHLVMGPWTHSAQLPQSQGQLNFGALASAGVSRLPELVLAFFRRHLADADVPLPRVKYFLMNAGEWRESGAWPPPSSTPRRLYLGAGGTLGNAPTAAAPACDRFDYDPADPTPTVGGHNLGAGRLPAGPISQEALARRADLLRYTGSAVTDALDLVGAVTATLFVSSSAPDTDFIVKLLDVDPAGIALPVCEGALRLRHRAGFEHEETYTPGARVRLTIPLGHTAWRVLPGHRLALQVQGANFPQLDANPNTGAPLGSDAARRVAANSVFRDGGGASFVEFNVPGDTP